MDDNPSNPRAAKHPVQEIADAVGGTITEAGILPDGSGFAIMSMPLPKDHWIYIEGDHVPPMPFRMGADERATVDIYPVQKPELPGLLGARLSTRMTKQEFADRIRMAGKYAIRCSTMDGKDMDFDPDAMLQNLVTGMLGYHTATGLSDDADYNPRDRTQWCCDGDGAGGHHKKCRYSRDNWTTSNPPSQGY